ncbi:Uncharacterised protein [Edwardsiella hoshinae]|uniref:Uncharacterized protein n=1 Tax=Edwardsiella hoshinae TaxID=93378 RepID=A0A376IY70_9GAMM|nr:hypothetical protein [Edwardsiella hoshinae]STE53336.1 Uncharacterised protein [Edwardsiella hoshinae]
MARDFKVSMTLEAKDDASRQVTRTLKETTGQAEKAAKAIKRQGHEQQKTAIEAAAAAKQQAAAAAQAAKTKYRGQPFTDGKCPPADARPRSVRYPV